MNALVSFPTFTTGLSGLLYKALQGVRQAQPRASLYEWARLLNTSEGDLQASRIGQENIWPLRDAFSVLYQLAQLQEVEVTAYNDLGSIHYCGSFSSPDLCLDHPRQLGIQFLTSGLHLKLQLEHWYWGCATEQRLDFFTRNGRRFMSLSPTATTCMTGWKALLQQHADTTACHLPLFEPAPAHYREHPMPQDLASLELEWRNMTDPQQISALLQRHKTTYFATLCSISPKLARSVSLDSFEQLLNSACQLQLPLCISMVSEGCIQTCKKALLKPCTTRDLLQLEWQEGQARLDPSLFEFAFITRKPLGDSWISSLEIFGASGEMLLQVQGYNAEGRVENLALREVFSSLL